MANLAEPLELVSLFRLELNKGRSVKLSLQASLQRCNTNYSEQVSSWLVKRQTSEAPIPVFRSAVRTQFLQLVDLGLRGGPIAEPMAELEQQMIEICHEDIQAQLEKLPVLMSLPLVFCFLPAFLILILGPVVSAFTL